MGEQSGTILRLRARAPEEVRNEALLALGNLSSLQVLAKMKGGRSHERRGLAAAGRRGDSSAGNGSRVESSKRLGLTSYQISFVKQVFFLKKKNFQKLESSLADVPERSADA